MLDLTPVAGVETMGEMITVKQAVERTEFKAAFLRRLCQRGFFPSAKNYGGTWVLDEDDLKLLDNRPKPGRPTKKE